MSTIQINVPNCFSRLPLWFVLIYYRLRYGYSARFIHIQKFRFAIVDPADYDLLHKHKWRLNRSNRTYYAFRTVSRGPLLKPRVIWMHRFLMNPPDDLLVDHHNHNGLDNRRSNLRLATDSTNQQNARKRNCKTTSRFKGVDFVKPTGKWRARISVNGKRLFLGSFTDELDAAMTYDEAAKKYFGEYACLNFNP